MRRKKEIGDALKGIIRLKVKEREWSINFVMREFRMSYAKVLEIIDDGAPITSREMEIVEDIARSKKTKEEILKEYNINEYTLNKIKARHKVKFKRKDTLLNKERDGLIVSMAKAGKTVPEIVAVNGMNRQRVWQILEREGVSPVKGNKGGNKNEHP